MICVQKNLEMPPRSDLSVLTDFLPEEERSGRTSWLFFDIETTGLARERHQIYLIGVSLWQNGTGSLWQWLARSAGEEREVLTAFLDFTASLEQPAVLVHFNGTRFDLPFFQTRCRVNSLNCDAFSSLPGIDLYEKIRPFKKLLGLASCRQKAIEDFLNISREDQMSGKELIPVFHRYCDSRRTKDEKLLLLHNEEDVQNLPCLTAAFSCVRFLRGAFRWNRCEEARYTDWEGNTQKELFIIYTSLEESLPLSFTAHRDFCWISCRDRELTLRLPLLTGRLKYFFPDYKNYYYLPAEDQAIHKSVAVYVDPAFRQKATRQNCYNWADGFFLPAVRKRQTPCFYQNYGDKQGYLCWNREEPSKQQAAFFENYLKELLEEIENS